MGASEFASTVIAKDAVSAFDIAREQAAWRYGHGGYTGTIAEKGDFFLVPFPSRTTVDAFINHVRAAADNSVMDNFSGIVMSERNTQRFISDDEQWLVERLGRKITDDVLNAANDKWGPAIGFEVRGVERTRIRNTYHVKPRTRNANVFVFFGLASL